MPAATGWSGWRSSRSSPGRSMRGFGLERGFPLDALIAYTPYVAVAALLAAGIALALRNWAAAAVGALALVWLAAGIAPRAIGSDEQPRPRRPPARRPRGQHPPRDRRPRRPGRPRRSPPGRPPHDRGADPELRRRAAARRPRRAASRTRSSTMHRGRRRRHLLALPAAQAGRRRPRSTSGCRGRGSSLPGGRAVRVVAVHPYPPNPGSTASWSAGLHTLPSPEPGAARGSCRATSTRPSTTPNFAGPRPRLPRRRRRHRERSDPDLAGVRPPPAADHDRPHPRPARDPRPLLRGRGHPRERSPRRLRTAGDPAAASRRPRRLTRPCGLSRTLWKVIQRS